MKIEIDKPALYEMYMDRVNYIVEEDEFKTHFTPVEIVYIIAEILEEHSYLIENK